MLTGISRGLSGLWWDANGGGNDLRCFKCDAPSLSGCQLRHVAHAKVNLAALQLLKQFGSDLSVDRKALLLLECLDGLVVPRTDLAVGRTGSSPICASCSCTLATSSLVTACVAVSMAEPGQHGAVAWPALPFRFGYDDVGGRIDGLRLPQFCFAAGLLELFGRIAAASVSRFAAASASPPRAATASHLYACSTIRPASRYPWRR